MIRPSHLLASATIALLALAGCGGETTTVTVTQTASTAATGTTASADAKADEAIAERAVLQLSDLPVGWTETRASDEDDDDKSKCDGFVRARELPRAQSADFTHGDDERVEQVVVVLPTTEDAGALIDDFVADATTACLASELQDEAEENLDEDDVEAELSDVETARVNIVPHGQRSEAVRFVLPVSADGFDAEVYAEFTLHQVGRGVVMLALQTSYTAPDDDLRSELGARAVELLSDALEVDRR